MAAAERFRSMDEVRAELARRTVVRNGQWAGLQQVWTQLNDAEFRTGLVATGLRRAVEGIPWSGMLAGLLVPGRASAGQVVGMALGAGARSRWGRVAGALAGLLLPALLERLATPERVEHLAAELERSWDRVLERLHRRAKGPEEHR